MAPVDSKSSYSFRIHGMDCAEEVAALNRAVGPVVGGEERLQFDVLRGRMRVLASEDEVPPGEVRKAVARTGMRAEPWSDDREGVGAESFWARHGRTVLTTLSGLLATLGFLLHAASAGAPLEALAGTGAGDWVPWSARALYAVAILAGAWHILPRAWGAARGLRPDMNLLMTVAIAGAVILGEWLEAASVAFLFALSQLLESWSVGRARRAVGALLDLSPTVARIRRPDGREETLAAEDVPPGSTVVVKPGEKIPLDGEVAAGASEVDQAPITGESLPVAKEAGDEVFAGTINGGGALEVRTTRAAEETTLAHIVRLVEEAQARRSPSERWVERFARIYTPAVMGLAAAVMVLPPVALTLFGAAANGSADWSEWFYRGLVLLVIGCPCALVISTPVSIVAALASAARHGVLIKGGLFVEAPARLAAIAFDKTGTLTRGEPRVVEVVPLGPGGGPDATDDRSADRLLRTAASLEARSEHPLARAIVEHAGERGLAIEPAEALRSLPGRGAVGTVEGRETWVGSHRYLVERTDGRVPPEVDERLQQLSAAGQTAVVVGDADGVLGLIAMADTLRPETRDVIRALHRRGLGHLVMLTGDNEPTARAVAAEAGIDEYRAELLPEDKVGAVEALVERYEQGPEKGTVAMVGDGVNDAPAMGRSGLGIAMGAAGTDAAIETADIALMADDLTRLPWLVDHSRRTVRIIRQNIGFALGVKLVVFLLATVGWASLWAAIAADMGASLLVIANALRLLRG